MSHNLKHDWADHWDITRDVPLNHGSFGATPTAILDLKAGLDRTFNQDRETFFWDDLKERTDASRAALADFVGADVADLVLVDNVSEAFNSVIRSLPFGTGDEVLTTNHIYSLFPPLLKELSARQGFRIVTADIPYPAPGEDAIAAAVAAAVTPRTRLAIVDHISSPTAIIFPIRRIVAELAARGVDCFVDGAHAPGQVAVDIRDIGAAYYAGNNHKWLCAPAASGFLHVRRDRQERVIPAVASWGGDPGQPFADRFDWNGTKDFGARLVVPETIDAIADMVPGGWPAIRERNHVLAVAGREILFNAVEADIVTPDAMIGSMFTVPLGKLKFDEATEKLSPSVRLREAFRREHGYGVYAIEFGGQYIMRISAHLYNNIGQYETLAAALPKVVAGHRPR